MAEPAPAEPAAPQPSATAAEGEAALAEAAGLTPEESGGDEKASVFRLVDARMWLIIFGSVLILMMFFTLPTLIILCVGMLPAVVAAVVDRSEQRHVTYSVTSMNFAGVFPFVLGAWTVDHSVHHAVNVVTSSFALSVMYAAAALGWLVHLAVPPVIAQFLAVLAQRRVDALHAVQRTIIEEWGPETADGADISHLNLSSGDDDDGGGDDGGDDGFAPPKTPV